MGKTISRKFQGNLDGKKSAELGSVDDIRMTGKKMNMAPMQKELMKNVTYIWDALNVHARRTKQSLNISQSCLNRVFSAGATDKTPGSQKPHAQTSHGLTTWKDMLKSDSTRKR